MAIDRIIIGSYERKIDDRGRIVLPIDVRKYFGGIIYLRDLNNEKNDENKQCYELVPKRVLVSESRMFKRKSPQDDERIYFFSRVKKIEIDNKGRILLPNTGKDISKVIIKGNYDRVILEVYYKRNYK